MGDARPDQPLPASQSVERLVLGAILRDPTLYEPVAARVIREDFSQQRNRLVYDSMQALVKAGSGIDYVTVAEELKRQKKLDSVGGLTYMMELDEAMPVVVNINSYIQILREHSLARRLISSTDLANKSAWDNSLKPMGVLQGLRKSLDELEGHYTEEELAPAPRAHVEELQLGGVDGLIDPNSVRPAISTGFPQLDDLIYGFQPQRLYVLGGDTGAGKSSLAVNMAEQVSAAGFGVLFFSLEMTREDVLQRLICRRGDVSLWRLKTGRTTVSERYKLKAALDTILDLPLYIDETPSLKLPQIYGRTVRAVRSNGIRLVVIDYVQIITFGTSDEREALTGATKLLKELARREAVPILLVSQLSRARTRRIAKEKEPQLSDLHGSSSLEKDSDVVMFIYRPDFDDPLKQELRDKAKLIVRKHRNGPRGEINMAFDGQHTSFRELPKTDEQSDLYA